MGKSWAVHHLYFKCTKFHYNIQVGFILNSVLWLSVLELFDWKMAACNSTNEVDSEPFNQAVYHKIHESTLDTGYYVFLNWQLYDNKCIKIKILMSYGLHVIHIQSCTY